MNSINGILATFRRSIRVLLRAGKNNWSEIEYFNPAWRERIRTMAEYIDGADSIVDLGCGQMWLKDFLDPSVKYTGVDYKTRGDETIVCDFNQGQYPGVDADVYFVSGCLEYVTDYQALVKHIARHCRTCIISYCCVEDFADLKLRRRRAWVNDLHRDQLVDVFSQNGMALKLENKTLTNNSIFVFRSIHKSSPSVHPDSK